MNRQSAATLPPEMGILLHNYAWSPAISTTEPVSILSINFAGYASKVAPYAGPFKALRPVSMAEGETPYSQIAKASGTDVGDPLCAHGTQRMQFAPDLSTYNITTNRAVL
ncbi:FAD-binding domain-containing protein [Apiospora kogelbergensis]|uniref:FAD-binding domain-containing protein n=1 Tax=Apiospora kogelbergensis TaxID=1337665 RepID=UPI0031300A84